MKEPQGIERRGQMRRDDDREQRLSRTDALLEAVTELLPVCLAYVSADGRYRWTNRNNARRLGRQPDEIVGKHLDEVLEPEYLQAISADIGNVLRGQSVHNELTLMGPAAEGTRLERHLQPHVDANGRVAGYVSLIRDVTEREIAAQALRASEERLRTIIDADPECVKVISREGELLEMNRAGLAMLEAASLDELKQKNLIDLVDPAYHESFRRLTRRVFDGEAGVLQFEVTGLKGTRRWLEARAVPLHDAHRGIYALLSITRDISEAKRAEAELKSSNQRFRQLAENIREVFWLTDPAKNQMLYVSPAYEQIWQQSCDALYASPRTWIDAIHPEDRERIGAAAHAQQQHGEYDEEYRVVRPDGSIRWIHDRAFPVVNEAGVVYRVAGIAEDITERKLAEAQVLQLNETLEERVHERTRELELANQELEAFSYSVSHDLKAPLRHIQRFAEILCSNLGAGLDAENRRYLDGINNAARRMGDLIVDLLEFSRLGRVALRKASVDVNVLVREALQVIEPDMHERDIVWRIGPLPTLFADRALLRQVLVNLLSNAVKYTRPRARAEIEIGCEPGSDLAVLFVRDNGVGFDMQYADKLFGVFQRLHRAVDFEGTGIGLAIVHSIVARHGGRTWARAEENRGATFYFSLPR